MIDNKRFCLYDDKKMKSEWKEGLLCQGICEFIKQFHIGAANLLFCFRERFFRSDRALKSAVRNISVKKGMELTLHAFFIYKI
ncbi:hypothetical protein B4071_1011 [Bacillus subtilis]|nr:hypothetical protein B4071_1011 [Bacillus subtilis]